jgi:hypothetical protein
MRETTEIIKDIKTTSSAIPLQNIRFSRVSAQQGTISRLQSGIRRNTDLYKTFKKYADEEQDPKLKARFIRDSQRYENRLSEEQKSLANAQARYTEANTNYDALQSALNELAKAEEPLKILEDLGKVITAMKNLGQDTKQLEELYTELLASLEQEFTVILEYAVSA